MLAYFGVSIIHQTETWTTRFLTCISVIFLRGYMHVGLWFMVLFWCFHNPPNSDMDYKVFNLHKFVIFLLGYIYTHGTLVHFLIQRT